MSNHGTGLFTFFASEAASKAAPRAASKPISRLTDQYKKRHGVAYMPLSPRIQSADVLFHVINRGNNRQRIFLNTADFEYYLALLKRYKAKYSISIFHYVLMTNHVHLLLQPNKPNTISKFMHGVTLGYTRYFNYYHRKIGRLWQSRFKAIPIDADSYYLTCAKYIEFNPVRAGVAQKPEDYPWSSYKHSTKQELSSWVNEHPLLVEYGYRPDHPPEQLPDQLRS